MYKLLIVDDEYSIRNGLKSIIPWEDLGIEIVGEAENGTAALLETEKLQPDIVLTDIRMPQTDGIELVKLLQKRYPNIKTAILSGFDDFEYVRAAMRYGATNYLLKPVDREELIVAMREIIETISSDVQDFLKYREFLQLLQKNTLNRIISNQISLKELREKCEMLNISFQSRAMRVALVQLSILEDEHWKIFAALNICDETIDMQKNCYTFSDSRNNIVIIFKNQPKEMPVVELLQKCLDNIEQFLKTKSVAAVGTLAQSHRQLKESYEYAIKLLNYQLLHGLSRIYAEPEFYIGEETPLGYDLFEEMLLAIEQLDLENLTSSISVIFDKIQVIHAGNPEKVRYTIIDVISHVLNNISRYKISTVFLQKLKEQIYLRVQNIKSAKELLSLLQDFSETIVGKINESNNNTYSHSVKHAIDYINNKYYDYNISLKTLGDMLNINPAYLGRLFKQETGDFFSDYLNKTRVYKAKDLLIESPYKANEIAEKVGFSSISYFYTVFKKITGQNPGDLRKQ